MRKIVLFSGILFLIVFTAGNTGYAQKSHTDGADESFEKHEYTIAIEKYKKAYTKVKGNKAEKDRINYQLAECYRMINNFKRAEIQYRRLLKINYQQIQPLIILHYADALKAVEKYDEAKTYYEQYTEIAPEDPRGPNGVQSCNMIQEWIENPTKYAVENVKKLNSRDADFSPTFASENFNDLVFTSTREGAKGEETDAWTDQNFSSLWYARIDRKEEWSEPTLLDNEEEDGVNTDANEGAPFFNDGFTKLYFTRCPKEDNTENGCQIWVTQRTGRSYSNPTLILLGNDTNAVIGHPTLTEDELAIYFASDRRGGLGGRDIWVATRESKSEDFGRPMNLGPKINTPGDEVFPYLRYDTVLYFASNGHIGMGGLDLFVSKVEEDDAWGEPENLGVPINSSKDDFGITFSKEREEGYFTSNRKGAKAEDIYYFMQPPVEFTLTGTVKDERSLLFVEDAKVELIGSDGTSVSTKTTREGVFNFGVSQLNRNVTYEIILTKDRYFSSKHTETTVGLEASKDIEREFFMTPIPDEPIVLPEILYDLAKWDLKPQYEDSLQGLIKIMDENPTIVIELAAHTDARDTKERNDLLSSRRARSVVNYLIRRGIDPDRLVAKGYGENIPRTIEGNIVRDGYTFTQGIVLTEDYINSLQSDGEREAAHQLNRRTEFSVLRNDFVPKEVIKDVKPDQFEISINPDDNILAFTTEDKTGYIQAECFINGKTMQFTMDKYSQASISLREALKLMNSGAIGKEDFQGDVEQALADGTIANNSIFVVKELRIANATLKDVEVRVNDKLRYPLVLGDAVLLKVGNYRVDNEKKELIFKQ